MTFYITAVTNNKARLIVSETRTDSADIAKFVAAEYERQGYAVARWRSED